MQWQVWTNGATEPDVYENQDVLRDYLSKQAPGIVVVVKRFDMVEQETVVYGLPGGSNPLPPPLVEPVTMTKVVLNHFRRG